MKTTITIALSVLFAGVLGCGQSPVATQTDETEGSRSTSTRYVAGSEPSGAIPVGEAREETKDEESVTLVGIIGGSSEPFVDGLAAFTIVDPKVPYCAPDEGCHTPWDYCCQQNQVKDNIATIKVVDEQGKPVAQDARTLLDVKELSTVVIEGTAQRDDEGNLSVLAKQVFVRSKG